MGDTKYTTDLGASTLAMVGSVIHPAEDIISNHFIASHHPALQHYHRGMRALLSANNITGVRNSVPPPMDVGNIQEPGDPSLLTELLSLNVGLVKRIEQTEGMYADLATALDVGWMLTAAILVFMMQAGFTLVESGSIRQKSSVSVAMKNCIDAAVGAIGYMLVGYGLAFGESSHPSGGVVGTTAFFVTHKKLEEAGGGASSEVAQWFFQYTFCATAATIVSGALAERCMLEGYIIISAVMCMLVSPVIVHWTWGGGWLARGGFQDFAGSGVVHLTGGTAAVVSARMLGPRLFRFDMLDEQDLEEHDQEEEDLSSSATTSTKKSIQQEIGGGNPRDVNNCNEEHVNIEIDNGLFTNNPVAGVDNNATLHHGTGGSEPQANTSNKKIVMEGPENISSTQPTLASRDGEPTLDAANMMSSITIIPRLPNTQFSAPESQSKNNVIPEVRAGGRRMSLADIGKSIINDKIFNSQTTSSKATTTSLRPARMYATKNSGMRMNWYTKTRYTQLRNHEFAPHNITYLCVGVFLLWFGWFGFNCGSTMGLSNGRWKVASIVAVNTVISAASGGLTAWLTSTYRNGFWDVCAFANGILAGLVGSTGSCNNVDVWAAAIIGCVSGLLWIAATELLLKCRIDDPVGSFPVHGANGIWGMLAVGFFDLDKGILYGNSFHAVLGPNIVGVGAIVVWSGSLTFLLCFLLKRINLMRVPYHTELNGLDLEYSRESRSQEALFRERIDLIEKLVEENRHGWEQMIMEQAGDPARLPAHLQGFLPNTAEQQRPRAPRPSTTDNHHVEASATSRIEHVEEVENPPEVDRGELGFEIRNSLLRNLADAMDRLSTTSSRHNNSKLDQSMLAQQLQDLQSVVQEDELQTETSTNYIQNSRRSSGVVPHQQTRAQIALNLLLTTGRMPKNYNYSSRRNSREVVSSRMEAAGLLQAITKMGEPEDQAVLKEVVAQHQARGARAPKKGSRRPSGTSFSLGDAARGRSASDVVWRCGTAHGIPAYPRPGDGYAAIALPSLFPNRSRRNSSAAASATNIDGENSKRIRKNRCPTANNGSSTEV